MSHSNPFRSSMFIPCKWGLSEEIIHINEVRNDFDDFAGSQNRPLAQIRFDFCTSQCGCTVIIPVMTYPGNKRWEDAVAHASRMSMYWEMITEHCVLMVFNDGLLRQTRFIYLFFFFLVSFFSFKNTEKPVNRRLAANLIRCWKNRLQNTIIYSRFIFSISNFW